MDYILFQSQFSPSCKKLLQQFPNLHEKSVSVDNAQMRLYIKKLHIVCVPTLILIMGNKIVERIVGYEPIQNWLLITIYRANQISQPQSQQQEPEPENIPIPSKPSSQPVINEQPETEAVPPTPIEVSSVPQQTSLDQLVLTDESETSENPIEDRSEPLVQMGSSVNTMQLAEALKKEREKNIEPKKKMSI